MQPGERWSWLGVARDVVLLLPLLVLLVNMLLRIGACERAVWSLERRETFGVAELIELVDGLREANPELDWPNAAEIRALHAAHRLR